jgi:hypothetical protein
MFFTPTHSSHNGVLIFNILGIALAGIVVWSFIVLLNCMAEIQGFTL